MNKFMTTIPTKIQELLRKEGQMFFTHILAHTVVDDQWQFGMTTITTTTNQRNQIKSKQGIELNGGIKQYHQDKDDTQ